jgi:hypothetical protein
MMFLFHNVFEYYTGLTIVLVGSLNDHAKCQLSYL